MVTNNSLQWHSFFRGLNSEQLSAVSLAAKEITCEKGELLFAEDAPANMLCLLVEGGVDLFCLTEGKDARLRELAVGAITSGEAFGLSALIEPHIYRAGARASARSRVLTVDAEKLRALCAADGELACHLISRVAETAMERLYSTQVQLAGEEI